MKKLFILLALGACGGQGGPTLVDATPNPDEALANVSVMERANVRYPFFDNEPKANVVIAAKVDGIIAAYDTADSPDGKVKYDVVREDDVVSIKFSGEVGGPNRAHPSPIWECGSFNARTGEILKLKRYGPINDKFVAMTKKSADAKLKKRGVKLGDFYNDGELKSMLTRADSAKPGEINDVCSWSTSDGAYIRISVPHAYGDFVEIRIPRSGV